MFSRVRAAIVASSTQFQPTICAVNDTQPTGARISRTDPNAIVTTPVEYDFTPDEEGGAEADGQGMYIPKDLDYVSETKRPIMSRDIIKTTMAAAGLAGRYNEAYQEDRVKNANVIKSLLR